MRLRVLELWALVVLLTASALGCGDQEGSPKPGPEPAERPASSGREGPTGEPDEIELYFTTGEQFRTVGRELPAKGDELVAATEALLAGPTAREQQAEAAAQTQIPAATQVEDVAVENGVAVVELSDDFTEGIPVDPAQRSDLEQQDLDARLAQVTFTLTQFDRVDEAKVIAGGTPVASAERRDFAEPNRGPVRKQRPRGAESRSTEQIQKRLAALRYLPRSAVDGIDGYRTEQAVIAFQSWQGLERDGIVGPATTAALAEARKPRPGDAGSGRLIEVHRAKGVALLIKGGTVKRAIHISSGAPGYETPAGSFEVFRKELKSWSVPYSVWLPYASYFNQGIAFHEYAVVPTFPASHGCVRVPVPEAQIVYRFATVGTLVVVI